MLSGGLEVKMSTGDLDHALKILILLARLLIYFDGQTLNILEG